MGEAIFHEPRWSFVKDDGDDVSQYLDVHGRASVADLLGHLGKVAPTTSLQDVTFGGGVVHWERPATADELAQRERWRARQRERHEAWRRRFLATLAREYGVDGLQALVREIHAVEPVDGDQ